MAYSIPLVHAASTILQRRAKMADGKQVFQGLLAANETLAVDFSDEAVLRIGNAGGIDVSLDGKSLGSLGKHGRYRMLKLRPDEKKKKL